MLAAIEALCSDLRKADLGTEATSIERWEDKATVLRAVVEAIDAASTETYSKRNRMAPRRFIERTALGALAAAQENLARRASHLAEQIERASRAGAS